MKTYVTLLRYIKKSLIDSVKYDKQVRYITSTSYTDQFVIIIRKPLS